MTSDSRQHTGPEWDQRTPVGSGPAANSGPGDSTSWPDPAGPSLPPPAWGPQPQNDNEAPWARPGAPESAPAWAPEQAERGPQPTSAPGYQPPGFEQSPNVVPLPPQPTRVPGASLAAAPPGDFAPAHHDGWPAHPQSPQPFGSAPVPPTPRPPADPYPSAQGSVPVGHAAVPQPPAPAEAKAGGSGPVSASATVPVANRLTPPADFAAPVTAAPQSRVYGRPVAEPAAEPQPYGHLPPASQPPQPPSHSAAPQPSPASGPGAPQSMPHPGWSPVAGTATPPQSHPAPGAAASASSAPFLPPQPQPAEPNWNASPEQWGNPSAGPDHASPAGPAWGPPPADDQERFNAFAAQQATEPATEEEAPPPQVRNGRVLLAVLGAAIAILAIPLGTLYLLGMIGSSSEAFNPAVGACVKQSGDSAAPADCAEPGAYSVVSKVDDVTKCADPNQPYIAVPLNGKEQILCLQPAGEPDAPAAGDPEPSASE